LSDLEEEGSDKDHDIDLKDLEDEEVKDSKKEKVKEIPKKEPVKIEKPIEEPPKQEITVNKLDLYSEKSENLYHRVDKMFSMGVLQDEILKNGRNNCL
jgi:hypothetical protein